MTTHDASDNRAELMASLRARLDDIRDERHFPAHMMDAHDEMLAILDEIEALTAAPLAGRGKCRTIFGTRENEIAALTTWVRKAMRFIDLWDSGETDLPEMNADQLTEEGYQLFGADILFDQWCLADLEHRPLNVFALSPNAACETRKGEAAAALIERSTHIFRSYDMGQSNVHDAQLLRDCVAFIKSLSPAAPASVKEQGLTPAELGELGAYRNGIDYRDNSLEAVEARKRRHAELERRAALASREVAVADETTWRQRVLRSWRSGDVDTAITKIVIAIEALRKDSHPSVPIADVVEQVLNQRALATTKGDSDVG